MKGKRFCVLLKRNFWAAPFLPFIIIHELSHLILINISGLKADFFIGTSSMGFRGDFELKNKRDGVFLFLISIAPIFISAPYATWLYIYSKEINLFFGLYLASGIVFIIPSTADFKMAIMAIKYLIHPPCN